MNETKRNYLLHPDNRSRAFVDQTKEITQAMDEIDCWSRPEQINCTDKDCKTEHCFGSDGEPLAVEAVVELRDSVERLIEEAVQSLARQHIIWFRSRLLAPPPVSPNQDSTTRERSRRHGRMLRNAVVSLIGVEGMKEVISVDENGDPVALDENGNRVTLPENQNIYRSYARLKT